MNRCLLISVILLACPYLMAGQDTTGIPFRVSALEERVDALEELAAGDGSGIVLADSEGVPLGEVTMLTPHSAFVWMEFGGRAAIFEALSDPPFFVVPPGPTLFFSEADCTGEVYTFVWNIEGGWLQPRVILAPGVRLSPEDPHTRVAYVAAGAPTPLDLPFQVSPEGDCNTWEGGVAPLVELEEVDICEGESDILVCFTPPFHLVKP